MTVVPVSYGIGGNAHEVLDGSGLQAHLAPQDNPDDELVYPCGTRFHPPPGRYRLWIQGGWRMSPYSTIIGYSGRADGPGIRAALPLVEAGRVALPREAATGPDDVLELLHAGSYLEREFPRWEILLRRPAGALGEGVLLPAGKAVGAVWDRKGRRYVTLSRPFDVPARRTVEVPLQQPRGVAHLVAQLRRHELAATAAHSMVDLLLGRESGDLPPDLVVSTADKVFAFWYDLAPGPVELRGDASESFLEPQRLDLMSGRIERVTGEMRPKPALEVQLQLPATLRSERLALELRRLPSGEVIARGGAAPASDTHRFERLPPVLLEVALETSLGRFTRQVDLSSGKDGFVVLQPEVVTVRGTVHYGNAPHRAKLTFTTVGRTTAEAHTDEEGAYEVVTVQPLRAVSVELQGVDVAPFFDLFVPEIAESKELDFRLPDVEFTVKVLDTVTHDGVPGAAVLVRNEYSPQPGDEEVRPRNAAGERGKVISQAVTTDETGTARLPPLRRGSLELRASAAGYLPPSRPVEAVVLDGETDQQFEVLLEPLGETLVLRLRLPDGAPAAGADVLLVDSLATAVALFEARADGEGVVRPPRMRPGSLLVRHPAAGFLVREWRPRDGEAGTAWDLPAAAGRPLTIQVKDASGQGVAPRAELALWIGGHRLSGKTLAWLASAPPMADGNGHWIGRNLPQGPVGVLAWSLRVREEAWAGSLDAQATGVGFPWPDPVEVRAFE